MLKCLIYHCRSLLHEQIASAHSFIRQSRRAQLQCRVFFNRMGYLARTSLSQFSSPFKISLLKICQPSFKQDLLWPTLYHRVHNKTALILIYDLFIKQMSENN